MNIFADLEQSGFATWVRESPSLLGYPMFLTLHTVGLGLLVGTSTAIDLRILGFGRQTALPSMSRFFPLLWLGFWISLISGAVLWIADATVWSKDVVFYIKIGFIALGIMNIRLIRTLVFRNPTKDASRGGKVLAISSLFLWVCAITAGRLTAYIGK